MTTPSIRAERDRFVADLLAYMTLEEKAGQLVVLPQAPDPLRRRAERDHSDFFDRLRSGTVGAVGGIVSDVAAESLQRIAIEETRMGIPLLIVAEGDRGFVTLFPSPIAAAASWDVEAISLAETAFADEAMGRGINWVLAPEARLVPDSNHPDLAHASGSDPYLASRIAVARINGLQQRGQAGESGILACLGLSDDSAGATSGAKDTAAVPPLRLVLDAIADGPVGSINIERPRQRESGHTAYAAMHATLEFLHRPGNYGGMILSDWADLAALAGQDHLARGIHDLSADRLVAAVRDGRVSESLVDDAVRRVLAAKFDLGLFQSHLRPPTAQPSRPTTPRPRTTEAAMDLARRSIILLRNDGELLPLGDDSRDVLVIGSAARDASAMSNGHTRKGISVIDGLEQLGVPFKFAPGLALRHEGVSPHRPIDADRLAIGMASEAARRARTVVVVLGQDAQGLRHNALNETQRLLLSALFNVNRRIVLVTLGDRPINPAINGEPLPCVVHAGQLGTMGGLALAEVLTGEFNPSGRLPIPLIARDPMRSLPFGFGLSYGTVRFAEFSLEMGADRVLASIDLRNFGDLPCTGIAQLYQRRLDGPETDPRPLLCGFERMVLHPGERRRITFEVGAEQLATRDSDGRLVLDEGRYELLIGPDSVRLRGAEIAIPAAVTEAMRAHHTSAGQGAMLYGNFGRQGR